jgi:hypothetical protein
MLLLYIVQKIALKSGKVLKYLLSRIILGLQIKCRY